MRIMESMDSSILSLEYINGQKKEQDIQIKNGINNNNNFKKFSYDKMFDYQIEWGS